VFDLARDTIAAPGCHLYSGCGFPAPGTEIFDYPSLAEFTILGIHFTIDKPVILVFIGSAVILLYFAAAFSRPRLVPGKLQSTGELCYLFIRDQISRPTLGKSGDRYVPILFTLFFFVLILNLMGVFPGAQNPPTAYFVYPVVLAVIVWITYMFLGMQKQGPVKFFTNMMFPPGVPAWVLSLLAPIEFLSNVIIRPFTLALRLMANMFAGHLLLTVFISGAFYLFSPSWAVAASAGSAIMALLVTAFKLMIQVLQAYIFTLLTASYIAGSVANEH
jgi:F-type H+-transporting ATPase subunit a